MQNKTLTVGSLLFSFDVLFAIYGACFPVDLSVKTNTEKSTSSRDSSVKILECGDKTSECRAVASEIKKLLRSGKVKAVKDVSELLHP